MLGDQPLLTYLCEKPAGWPCAICWELIQNKEIYFSLFINDPRHQPVPIHRTCARGALETFILKRELRESK